VGVTVDCGPATVCSSNEPDVNTLFVTVTICQPGTSTCATIDHVQVDTGSYGLRVLSQALPSGFTLPYETATTSGPVIAECTTFADGYSWGPMALADVQISDETAASVPVQVIGDPNYNTTVPTSCSNGGGTQEDTVLSFGANGILGIGPFPQDCGSLCATELVGPAYYTCATPATCTEAEVQVSQQTTEPNVLFLADNNGTIVELPSIPQAGQATVNGYLIFGIGTETNNTFTAQSILWGDPDASVDTAGDITTNFNGEQLPASYIDSGSNGYFFADSSITPCTENTGFYCPTSPLALTATLQGASDNPNTTSTTYTVDFTLTDVDTLSTSFFAFPDVGGGLSPAQTQMGGIFDWGLTFFFGRNVYIAIQCSPTTTPMCATNPEGEGPYFAY